MVSLVKLEEARIKEKNVHVNVFMMIQVRKEMMMKKKSYPGNNTVMTDYITLRVGLVGKMVDKVVAKKWMRKMQRMCVSKWRRREK